MVNEKKVKKNTVFMIGAGAVLLAALFWSIDGTFIRPKLYDIPAGLVVFIEHVLGFIVLSPFLFRRFRQLKNLDKKSWGASLWVSFFGGFLGTLAITKAFFAAIDGEVTFATVIILQKLQPVFALIMARLILKEKLSKQFYVWAGLAVLAAYILAFGESGLAFGDIAFWNNAALLALLAAFAFGSSTVFGKRLVNHLDFKTSAALRFGMTIVIAGIYLLVSGGFSSMSAVTGLQWQLFALIVFTSGALSLFIYYFGLRRISASAATIAELFWPLSAVILDYVFNGNTLDSMQLLSAGIMIIAMYQVIRRGKAAIHPPFFARVIDGEGRGKKLGTPTANLDKTDLDLPHGIYTAKILLDGIVYKGLVHFGFKETFQDTLSLEAYLHDFSGDVSGKKLQVTLIEKLRDVAKFDTKEELVAQMENDKKALDQVAP